MTESSQQDERIWGGTTLAERRKQRRAAFMTAALNLIGEHGTPAVTMRALCRETGIADRYFYESFESRDDLLVQLFKKVADETYEFLADKADLSNPRDFARTYVETVVDLTIKDRRRGRLLVVEPMGEPALRGITLATLPAFTKLLRTALPRSTSQVERAIVSIGFTGAIGSIILAWLSGDFQADRDELVAECVKFAVRVMTVD